MGGMPNNQEPDHPMSVENPVGHVYAAISDTQKELSGSQPSTNGDLNIIPNPPESHDQLPRLPLKRTISGQSNPPPPIPTTRRPSGAIETLAMGVFQLSDEEHPRKASLNGARVNAHQQWQEKPPLLPRARRPSELGDPSTPIPEENTPQVTYPPTIWGQKERVYGNLQCSDMTDPSNHLPERYIPQTTNPASISEEGERLYGNVMPTVAKIPVESHDEGVDDITGDNVYLEFGKTGEAPVETQQI